MEHLIYISHNGLQLRQYMPRDTMADWQDWQDHETQAGYNTFMEMPYDRYRDRPLRHRLYAVIAEDQDPETPLGIVMISPPPGPPDLAIRVFAPYRGHGLGTAAFSLAARYAKEQLGLENLHAGCYEGNVRSEKMLLHCGFQRFPEGDIREEHYLTGAPIWQYDYVL